MSVNKQPVAAAKAAVDPYATRDAPTNKGGDQQQQLQRRLRPVLRKTPPPPPPRPKKESREVAVVAMPPPLPAKANANANAPGNAKPKGKDARPSPPTGPAAPRVPWPPPAFPLAIQAAPRARPTFVDSPMLARASGGTAPPANVADKKAAPEQVAAQIARESKLSAARLPTSSGGGGKWLAAIAAVIVGVLVWRIEQMGSSSAPPANPNASESADAGAAAAQPLVAAVPPSASAALVEDASAPIVALFASVRPPPPAPAPTPSFDPSVRKPVAEDPPDSDPRGRGEMIVSPLLGAYRSKTAQVPPATPTASAAAPPGMAGREPQPRAHALAGAPSVIPSARTPNGAGRVVVTPAWGIPGAPVAAAPAPATPPPPPRRAAGRGAGVPRETNPNVDARSIMNAANPPSTTEALIAAGKNKGRVDLTTATSNSISTSNSTGGDRVTRASEQIEALLKKPVSTSSSSSAAASAEEK